MFKKLIFFGLLILIAFTPVFAQLQVRLASPLPRNSDWGRTLDRIAGEWARVTNNQVRLRVIHDGLEGSDARMRASLNANNIQAALFTSAPLAEMVPSVMTLSAPFLIRNDAEYDAVLSEVIPILNEQMNRTNYVAIAWSKGGWVYIFSREPVFTPDDLKRQRLSTSPDMRDLNTAFRMMGFNLVETGMTDIGTRLANNMINAIYLLPEAIAPLGLHRQLRNYLDMPIAPFVGAIVMNRVTWNRISPQNQREILRVTQSIATEFDAVMTRTAANAVTSMQRDGLTVNRPTAQQQEMWQTEMNNVIPQLLGTTFDRDMYNRINRILENHRSTQGQ